MSYLAPETLEEALHLLAEGDCQILAGATDIYPGKAPDHRPKRFLDVTGLAGLNKISSCVEGTRFGAAVTWTDIIDAELPPLFDGLKAAAREVGSVQIQNVSTLVGNVCNASPAADGVPVLLALNAEVEVASAARGMRRVALEKFIVGAREIDMNADELVTGIWVPAQPFSFRSAFEKLGARRYLVISICMTAVCVRFDDDGRIAEARIAVGACSAVAQRMHLLEKSIQGKFPREVRVKPDHLAALTPIDDSRGTAEYRRAVVRFQIQRVLERASYK